MTDNLFMFNSNMAIYWVMESFAFGVFLGTILAFLRWIIFGWLEKWRFT